MVCEVCHDASGMSLGVNANSTLFCRIFLTGDSNCITVPLYDLGFISIVLYLLLQQHFGN